MAPLMLLVSVPWSQRGFALPVLSVPTLTPATSAKLGKRHRTTIQTAQTLIWLVRRWFPKREIVLVVMHQVSSSGNQRISKQIDHVLVQGALIGFEGQHMLAVLLFNLFGDLRQAAHRIDADNAACHL